MTSGKFSLQWVNDSALNYKRSMNTAVFTLRDPMGHGCHASGGLTCTHLHLDQVHVHFRPTTQIQANEFLPGDRDDLDYRAETQQLYVRVTPGTRHVLFTDGTPASLTPETGRTVVRSLVYSTALSVGPSTGLTTEDPWVRTYRPVRDLPVLSHVADLSEIQLDLLWPTLHGDPNVASTIVPDYRILRVIAEFSYAS